MVCRPSQDKKKRRTLQNGKTKMLFSAFSLFLAFASSTPLNQVKSIFMVTGNKHMTRFQMCQTYYILSFLSDLICWEYII